MRLCFFIASLFVSLSLTAQTPTNTSWDNGTLKDVYTSIGKNLIRYTYFNQDGIKLAEGSYRQGRKHGVWFIYYPSGAVKGKFYYLKGAEEGKQIFYFETGKKQEEYNYQHGQRLGQYILYYENGVHKEKGQYLNVPFHTYIPAAPPQDSTLMFLPGMASIKSGKITQYYESGKIKLIQYFDSQYNILVEYEDIGGKINLRLQNKEIPIGIWIYLDEAGKITKQETYREGQLTDHIDMSR